MPTQRLQFDNGRGQTLSARLEEPPGPPQAHALFAHCFTCGKDVKAATVLTRALADRGYGVLRFDFTGLGNSDGDFANENFSSNVDDLVAAAEHMERAGKPVSLLLGHSLGGAAVLRAAGELDTVAAVATIAAPADPEHVARLLDDARETIEEEGQARVTLAGRTFTIKKQFLDDLEEASLERAIAELRRPLLILHGPRDEVVGIDNASKIFQAAKHPKSFVSLDDADHLLSRREHAIYAAQTIAAWASRYVRRDEETKKDRPGRPGTVHTETLAGAFRTEVQVSHHHLVADEPEDVGGADAGPTPYDLLLAALGTCTTMTLQLYAKRKDWPLTAARAHLSHDKIHAEDCEACPDSGQTKIDVIERRIELCGELTDKQRERLLNIADKCPVHRTLESDIVIKTTQWSDDK